MANETSANTGQKDMGFVIAGGVAMALIILAITVGIRIADPQGGGGGGGGNTEANITLSEYKIDGTLTVPAGNVVLNITNSGSVEHNLQVVELGKKTANLKAGQSEKLDLGTLEPGVYNIDCTVAGHKDSGMSAKLTVTEGGGGLEVAAGDASGTDGTESEGAVTHSHDELANGLGTPEEYAALDKAMNDSVTSFLSGEKAIEAKGTLPLEFTTSADGYKVFNITAEIIDWEVEKGKTVKAWAYNKQVPGPTIKVNVGDKVRIHLENKLPMGTDLHLHGVTLQNNTMDGVAPLTQDLIEPGGSYDYEFIAEESSVAMYHAHHHGHFQVINGLFAPLITGNPGDWIPRGETISGRAIPANVQVKDQIEMVLNDAGNIGLTLNGKSFPSTDAYKYKQGDWFIVNYYNEGFLSHPMHLHQLRQLVVAKDGIVLEQPYWMDTLNVAPGERYTVAVEANELGAWVWHCHILNHVERDEGVFGMLTAVIVE